MREEWRVYDWDGPALAVSSMGRIKKPDRRGVDVIVSTPAHDNGYERFYYSEKGKTKAKYVHRIVCEAFHGPAPLPDMQVAHEDGSRNNHSAANLAWKTPKENASDKLRHGTLLAGEDAPRGKLTETCVYMMRSLYGTGKYEQRDLADMFNVSTMAANKAIRGASWGHLPMPYTMPPKNRWRGQGVSKRENSH